ncbi:bestrophin family ion channel [Pseudomonas sp. NPDC007930]|uniref:bestrophin family protein n=1 Tax=Pseudomonas sp. NPDC007930 TaxID=3364417 RepID=UPI0036F0F8E0
MIVRPHRPSLMTVLFAVRGSIVPAIWRKVLYTVLLSSAVAACHGTLFQFRFSLTATPFTLWGLTLAIFLGFRNTVAYQRYWEARTLWGELTITTRNLVRQLHTLVPGGATALAGPLLAFAYLLRDQLREVPASADARRLLGEAGAVVEGARGKPGVLLGWLGRQISEAARQAGAGEVVRVALDQSLNHLGGVLGGCERIRGTPIPYPYILMLHRVVHVYCFLLPFCLVGSLGWFTPVAVCVLAYTFFGLDALGEQIADPFDTQPNDLPLDAMCRNLEISVCELLGQAAPEPLQPVNNILL